MVMHAGLAGLLTRLGAGEDIPVGAPAAGRDAAELQDLVGYFVNTLVLRTDTSSDPTFGELVDRVRETDLAAYAHQDLPFDRIVEEVRPPRSPARHPLFQVMLAMQAQAPSRLDMPGLETHPEPSPQSRAAKFDLSMNLAEQGGPAGETAGDTAPAGLTGELEFNRDLFDEHTATTLVSRLVQLLEAMADDAAVPLGDADILLPREREQLHAGTDGQHRPVRDRTIVEAFARQAAATPTRTAVATAESQLTFADLDTRSHQLASTLAARGIGRGSTVAVLVERTVQLPVALLGVLRSGAACLPLDPTHPPERIAYMLRDSRPECVLAEPDTELTGAHLTYRLNELLDERTPDAGPTPRSPDPDDIAYVSYTSGSTGRPKGIAVEHRSLANLLEAHRAEMIGRTAADMRRPLRVAHTAGMSFDASWDPVLWMVDGHELHIVAESVRTDAQQLLDYLAKQHIDVIETTPSYVRELVALGLVDNEPRPRLVALGGEPVDPALWQQLAATPGVTAYNLYGPAEATVDTVTACTDDEPTPAIGTPIANVSARVLDSRLRPVPAGVIGELYLAGAALARGYLNRPDLTAARFVADPRGSGERMYRTGDLAVRRPTGALHHMGRSDDQVKIRGHRIEPGEIEAVLSEYPDVAQAAAVVDTTNLGDVRIIAYVTAHSQPPDTTELREHAANRLPAALVPSAVTVLSAIPRTPNGKLDHSALPAPELTAGGGRAPRTRDERYLCEIFAEVLDVPNVSLDDDFFDLGGHSLLAVRLTARIRTVLGVHVAIRTVFEKPSPARLSTELDPAHRSRPPLRPRPRPQRAPLSYGQRRLWFLNRMDPTAVDYNLPMAVRIRGRLHVPALRGALADVVARHESLRTVFPEHDGVPYQHVLRSAVLDCPLLDARTGSDTEVRGLLAAHARDGFDLQHETPLRARLVRINDTEHVLLLVLHHIAGDGWSTAPLARDLSTAYAARVRDAAPLSPELTVQYVDFALWQREVLGDPDDPESPAARSLQAWQQRLAGAPQELNLPYDRRRGTSDSRPSGTVPVQIRPELHQRINTLARATSASPFMVLQAALAALYQRIGAGEDIVLGTPVAGRTDPALDDMVGFFVNTLALRTDTSGNPTFTGLLARVRDADLDAFDDQEVPFEQIVERVQPTRSPNRHPLFQTMLALQNNQSPTLELPGLGVVPEQPIGTGTAKFDLSFSLAEQECPAGGAAGIEGTLEYDGALFDAATAHSLVDHYVRLLDSASRVPDTPLGRLRLLDDDEHAALTTRQAPAPAAPPHTIVDLFVAQAHRTPEAVAVVCDTEQLTFAELESRSRGVAQTLTHHGARPGTTVAVGLPRGLAVIVHLLGVLRSGAAYLPLDLDHPTERIAAILDDAAPALVVGESTLGESTLGESTLGERLGEHRLLLPDELEAGPGQRQQPTGPNPGHSAYVIYTSGSTGQPKGVEVEHGSLANLFDQHRAELFAPAAAELGRRLRVAHTAGVAFDAAWDPVLWLVDGHELHLISDDVRRNPTALVSCLRERGIDSVETTPSHARQLLAEGAFDGPQAPTVVALGGEAIDPDLWDELGNRTQLRSYNFYGPTECTVDASIAPIAADTEPTLGAAVAGGGMYVLDSGMQPVPSGAEGELYISGAGLARGYLHRPALTGQRFIADPFAPAGTRMYRTGDRVRRLSDGSLQFQGRTDEQVTLRGYRIEPGEIQASLVEHDEIAEAAVAVQHADSAGERLVGYLVQRGHSPLSDHALREHLRQRVPAYMVPGVFVRMAELPLTVNGKLDRSALPDPKTEDATSLGAVAGNEPSGPRESVLCAVFADVLDLPVVGPQDGFFDLGGHSLLAAQLVTRASSALGTTVTVPMLFQAPTPARLLARADEGRVSTGLEPVLALRTSGADEPLFCIHPAGGLAWGYSGLLRHLQSSRPLYGIQVPGLAPDAEATPAPSNVAELADTYVCTIRSVQPEGPYHLLGWSFGGNLAHAVALRLGQLGHSVATLALMDAFPTGQDSNDPFTDEAELFGALVQALGYAEDGNIPGDLDAAGVLDLLHRHGDPMGSLEEHTVHAMVHSFGCQAALLRAHQPGVFDGDLLHFTATRGKTSNAPTVEAWQGHVSGQIIRHDIDVTHARMVRDHSLAEIGPRLDAYMTRALANER